VAVYAITGSTGFIGSRLAKQLRVDGHQVLPLGRISNADALKNIFATQTPDAVFHLATLYLAEHQSRDVEALVASNVLYGAQLLEAMRAFGVKTMVVAGTGWQRWGEDQRTPVNLYAATKNAFDEILRYYADADELKVARLLLYDTYGDADTRPKLIPTLMQSLASGESRRFELSPGEQELDIVHVEDVVRAFKLAVKVTEGHSAKEVREYRVSGGPPLTLKELMQLIQKVTGRKLNVELGAKPYRAREVMVTWLGAPTVPGWLPSRTLEQGLQQVWQSYAKNAN